MSPFKFLARSPRLHAGVLTLALACSLHAQALQRFDSIETRLTAAEGVVIRSLKIFRLKSIWANSNEAHSTNQ